ncbi:LysM peptidoglycan-binding domain-containing protein [Idiomarina sp. HP20-50]|uniref:lytic transglycosylase n=1 Tax=Idiomarina sp. HP20-50 TaxID=3070813 RepID=UPI00294B29D7|nr:LysM peptidoglycan-binding domain-containing protein [Idiomarina sp. HP20-50]MDV6317115.1 LysM peptidoglycan-binding domain-containing protein [Idiomarina sp. HP20-50]
MINSKRTNAWLKYCLVASGLTLSGCQSLTLFSDQNEPVVTNQSSGLTLTPLPDEFINNADNEKPAPAPEPVKLTPQEQENLWARIRQQLSFDVPDYQRVRSQRDWYASHPEYLDRVAKRAEPYLHLIVEELEKRDMPLDIALLPIVESAFDPFAYSHGSASGVWQFIPGTARQYGLDINWWYDGRRDVYAATQAALDYLQALHQYFDGNWMHALAAYNSGEGRVGAAIRKNERLNKPTDFWNLSLPRETRAYVPKLLALADILANSSDYGITWHPIENKPKLEVIETPAQIDLALAADMAGMPLDELHQYNSGYNRWATAPNGPHRLLLPKHNADKFKQALSETEPKDWLSWTRHKVESGESLLTISNKYNTSVDVIQQVNDISSHIIRTGEHLLVPVATLDIANYTLSKDQRREERQDQKRSGQRIEHIVRSGDTLWDLSRSYDVNLRDLARWNSMAPGDYLRPGQELVIWTKAEASSAIQSGINSIIRNIRYRVRSGDSLARIANKFNVTISQIEQWNNIQRNRYLQPGQMLKLKVDVTEVSS